MWGKLQTHGDKKNDAEVLAIAAAGAPLDVMAIFLNHTLRSCLTCALKNLQKQLINAPAILHVTGNLKTGKTLQLGQELNLKGEKSNGRICENTGCSDGFGSCGTVGGTDFLCACRTD